MNHSDFFKLIKKGVPCGTLLLHGEEEYVKAQAIRSLKMQFDEDFRPFNVVELTKPTPQELDESCETLPLFSDRRAVICYELADGIEAAKYADVITKHPEETLLVLVFKGKLAANSAVLKTVNKLGGDVLFDRLSASECARWCIKHANEAGVFLSNDAAGLLVRVVGVEMANLVSETDKLIDYVGEGGTVRPEDISICIRASLDVRIFDMLDMFTYGKPADGIIALHALIDEGNDPMSISGFLVSRFKLMLEARRGIDAGKNKRDVSSAMEGNRYANEKAYDAARRFTQQELLTLISKLSDTAYLKISGSVKEDKYIELVLLQHNWRQFPV